MCNACGLSSEWTRRFGVAGWILLPDWVHGGEKWHYSDDVGFHVALCGKRTDATDPSNAIDDIIGEPQENDCANCRRRLEERRQCADHAEPASA